MITGRLGLGRSDNQHPAQYGASKQGAYNQHMPTCSLHKTSSLDSLGPRRLAAAPLRFDFIAICIRRGSRAEMTCPNLLSGRIVSTPPIVDPAVAVGSPAFTRFKMLN